MIAQNLIDLGHIRKHGRINLRRAACDYDAGLRIIAFGFSDLTSGFCDGVICHGAGVDDDCAAILCVPRILRNDIRLISIQPTAEGNDFRSLIVGCFRHSRHVVEIAPRVKSCGHKGLRH